MWRATPPPGSMVLERRELLWRSMALPGVAGEGRGQASTRAKQLRAGQRECRRGERQAMGSREQQARASRAAQRQQR